MKDYNFFEPYQKKRELRIDFKSPVFLGIIVIFLIFASTAAVIVQNIVLSARLSNKTAELSAMQSSNEYQQAVKLQNSVDVMTEYDRNAESALQKIQKGHVLSTEFMQKLSAVLPSSVAMENATLTRTGATLSFSVPNQKAAAELVGNLDQSGLFIQTTLVSVTSSQTTGDTEVVATGFTASINCILKAGDIE